MRRADRLFQIVHLLHSRRMLTSAELADALGVSVRTIYRDVRDLQEADVPIRGEAGVGYALERGYSLPPLTFTTSELEALVLGARVVQSWADTELREAARAALVKVEVAIPATLRDVLLETPLFAPRWSEIDPDDVLGRLRRAAAERRRVRFAYTKADGTVSRRSVRPLGLYFWGRTWSLAAWCELREAYRNFRPDRISELEVLDVLEDSEDIDLASFIQAMRES